MPGVRRGPGPPRRGADRDFALLSFIPLALLLVGAFGLAFDQDEVRERVIATVFDHIPLARESDRDQLQRAIDARIDRPACGLRDVIEDGRDHALAHLLVVEREPERADQQQREQDEREQGEERDLRRVAMAPVFDELQGRRGRG